MSKQKLIVCNPGIFFKDKAPAVYPWILNKLSLDLGTKAYELQAKYDSIKAAGPGLLPEMAELFKGVESINMVCRQYCWNYARREVFELFRRFNERGHRYMFVTSLPQEICTQFANLTRMMGVHNMFVASQVLTNSRYGSIMGDLKKVKLVNRESRKDIALGEMSIILERSFNSIFHGGWQDVLVVGHSLTDIPLGKAVQEKGGRFVAFRSSDGDPMVMETYIYGGTLERLFSCEGLI